ncbi:MAG: hypothetical protein II830_01090, partial [Alphaproteobacteria bacterium]|nr:hypothetical protein [Alphaproteobacteria bacterium]
QTPVLGMGLGNPYILTERYFGFNLTYLHNNYIELLAGAGLIGTLLYYLLWAYPLYYFIRFFSLRNKETAVCLVMLILLLTVLDWGRVGYTSKQTYFYLMLFYLQVRVLKKTWLLQCKEKQYEME